MSANLDNKVTAPPLETRRSFSWRAAGVTIGAPAWVIFSMFGLASSVLIVIFRYVPALEDSSQTTIGQFIANIAVYALAVFFVLLPMLIKKSPDITALLGLDKKPTLRGFGWAAAAFIIYFWVTILVSILASYIPGFNAEQKQDVGFNEVTTLVEYLMAFVGLVVLPPFFEEILFRGYLFGRLRRHLGFWFATLVTSATFGFVHGQWNVGVDTFVLSIFLCLLREHTGSLWASMLLHGLKNSLAYFFLFLAPLLGINLL